MPTVRVKENEPIEVAFRRFKRSCEKAGILTETRRREFREKPTEERKRKAAAARKRFLKKMMRDMPQRVGQQQKKERGRGEFARGEGRASGSH